MIHAWRYAKGATEAEEIPVDGVSEAIEPEKALLWIDVADPSEGELESLATELGISPITVEDLRDGKQRTKLEHFGEHFHVAVHDCALTPHGLATREVDVVFSDGWLLMVRQPSDDPQDRSPFAIDAVKHRFELERASEDADDEGFLLWALLDVIVDRYFDLTDLLDDHLDEAEEVVFSDLGQPGIPREVFELRRSTVNFRRAAAPLREVIGELLRREADCLGPAAIVRMQDVYDHVLRVADLIESQRDLLAGLLEANLAVASNRMNEVMKRMTSWGAILLGSTLIAGIYGMNFNDMPELGWSFGYPAAIGSMVLLTLVLYVLFKRRGYL